MISPNNPLERLDLAAKKLKAERSKQKYHKSSYLLTVENIEKLERLKSHLRREGKKVSMQSLINQAIEAL